MKLVHWLLTGGLLHLVQQGQDLASHRCTKYNLSMVSVPITVLLHNGPLLCSFIVPVKGVSEF